MGLSDRDFALHTLILVISIIGLLINGIFICIVARIKSLQTPFNVILCNLAAACLYVLTLALVLIVINQNDPIKANVDETPKLVITYYVASDLFSLFLAIEQLLATFVAKKYSSFFKKKFRLAAICAGSWILAVLSWGLLRLYEHFTYEEGTLIHIVFVPASLFESSLFLTVHLILYLCIFTRLLRHPLGSSTLQRRVLIKLGKTSFAMFVSKAARIVCLALYCALPDERLLLRSIAGLVEVTTASIDPIIYGYLQINVKDSVKTVCSCFYCKEPGRFHSRSVNQASSKVSKTPTKRQNDQVVQMCID